MEASKCSCEPQEARKIGALYAGLDDSETNGERPKKQRPGRWFKENKPGICGEPVQHYVEWSNPPRRAAEKEDRREPFEHAEALESSEEDFFHSGWNVRRRRVMVALTDSGASPAVVSRFKNCGSRAWVWRNKHDGNVAIRADFCRNRLCVRCAGRVAARARAALTKLVEGCEPRLVTLTIAHSRGDALAVLVARLLEAFKALRREPLWSLRAPGGAYVLEVKYNHDGGGWHPHLHVLVNASFLPVEELGPLWRKHAGAGDFNVKRISGRERIVGYVCKYLTKQFDGSVFHHADKLLEVVRALRGTRAMSTFGDWRGVELQGKEEKFDADAWKPLCRFVDLVASVERGEPHGARIWRLISSVGEVRPDDPPPE